MWNWLPNTFAHGRLRMSTVLLSLLFVGVLTLYLLVRPPAPVDDIPPGPSERTDEPEAPTPTTTPSAPSTPDETPPPADDDTPPPADDETPTPADEETPTPEVTAAPE